MKDVTVARKDLTSRLAWQHVSQLENPNNWGLRGASLGSCSNLDRLHSPFRPLSEGKGGPRKLPEEGPALPVSRGWYVGHLYSSRSSNRESCRSWGNGTPSLAPARCCGSAVPQPTPVSPHRFRLGGRRLKPCAWGWCAYLCLAGLRLSGTFLSV